MSTTEPYRTMLLAHMQGWELYQHPFTCEYIHHMTRLNVQKIPNWNYFTIRGERVLTMRSGRTNYEDCQLDEFLENQTNGTVWIPTDFHQRKSDER